MILLHSIDLNAAILSDQLSNCTRIQYCIRELSELLDILLEYIQDIHGGGGRLRYVELHRRDRASDPILLHHVIILRLHLLIFEYLLQWLDRLFNCFVD